jgi:hypothetical protein
VVLSKIGRENQKQLAAAKYPKMVESVPISY